MSICAIVPSAGMGIRLQSATIKPLCQIDGTALIVRTLRRLSAHPLIDEIVVVFAREHIPTLEALIEEYDIKKIKTIVEGGSTRTQSVSNGLRAVGSCDFVLIHDGARPFVDTRTIREAIQAANESGAAVVGIPMRSTIKRIAVNTRAVECTLRREEMWQIQTPQVFRKDIIMSAYEGADGTDAPDDAFLVERLGLKVVTVVGSDLNIKITTPDDLVLAQAINNLIQNRTVEL